MTTLALFALLILAALALIAAGSRLARPTVTVDCAQPGQVNTNYKSTRYNKGN